MAQWLQSSQGIGELQELNLLEHQSMLNTWLYCSKTPTAMWDGFSWVLHRPVQSCSCDCSVGTKLCYHYALLKADAALILGKRELHLPCQTGQYLSDLSPSSKSLHNLYSSCSSASVPPPLHQFWSLYVELKTVVLLRFFYLFFIFPLRWLLSDYFLWRNFVVSAAGSYDVQIVFILYREALFLCD